MSLKYYLNNKNNTPSSISKFDLPVKEIDEQNENPFEPGFKAIKNDYYPPEFYKLRPDVMKRFNERCFICGEVCDEIHHIDYDKMNSDIDNLVLLCRKHHGQTNFNRNSWQIFFEREMMKISTKYKFDDEEDFDAT